MTSDDDGATRRIARPRFGVCGWDYKDWRGPLYPQPLPRDFRALPLLARFLDFMEVNATFYDPIGGTVADRWIAETPADFTFVIKCWRGWTHDGAAPAGDALARFRRVIDPILAAGRLDGVLAQYPPSFRDDRDGRAAMCALRDALAPARFFVEVRSRALYRREFLSFLQDEQLEFVNVDLPELPALPTLSTINTGPVGYVRLHGRNRAAWANAKATRDERYDYGYARTELEELTQRIRQLAARVTRLMVAANNHFRAQAPAAAVALRSLWEGRAVGAPRALVDAYPMLAEFTTPFDA
ncbi:MAG: DUF72 domain-containing protein [Planctomycetota bacterium]